MDVTRLIDNFTKKFKIKKYKYCIYRQVHMNLQQMTKLNLGLQEQDLDFKVFNFYKKLKINIF